VRRCMLGERSAIDFRCVVGCAGGPNLVGVATRPTERGVRTAGGDGVARPRRSAMTAPSSRASSRSARTSSRSPPRSSCPGVEVPAPNVDDVRRRSVTRKGPRRAFKVGSAPVDEDVQVLGGAWLCVVAPLRCVVLRHLRPARPAGHGTQAARARG